MVFQKIKLSTNVEKFVWNLDEDEIILNLKRELSLQITRFDIAIVDVKGYFILDVKFVSAVE